MRRNGFSLVELLVVIALIALLSSIALPVLKQGRNQGHDIVCASNLRQIGMASLVYAQEDQTLPQGFCGLLGYGNSSPTGIQGTADFDWQGWWWFDFLIDITGADASKQGLLWCPARNLIRGMDTDHVLCGNYGINTSICRIASQVTQSEFLVVPLKAAALSSASSTVLATDSGYALISWKALSPYPSAHPFECTSRQDTYYLPGAELNQNRSIHADHVLDASAGRHLRNRINAAYADAHVEMIRSDKLIPDFDAQYKPVNYSGWFSVKNR